jgi:PPOX class probable F420-dependent enzyme
VPTLLDAERQVRRWIRVSGAVSDDVEEACQFVDSALSLGGRAVNEREAWGRVAEARVARLATHDLGGRLHLVPICYTFSGETIYSAVDSKPKRGRALRRLANVAADSDACLLVDAYDEDWTALWWVRIRGQARILEAGAERERALKALRLKYAQYEHDPLDGPVLAIDIDECVFWDASS